MTWLLTEGLESQEKERNLDEISYMEEGRYLSVGEAVWDIFEFSRHGNTPPVVQLDLHLPGENNLVFDPSQNGVGVPASRSTMLTAFFELNRADEAARGLLYRQIPAYFVYKEKRWVRRSRGLREVETGLLKVDSLGRIPFVSPTNVDKAEVFALYLMLCNTKGPQSFEDLKTVNGVSCGTYVDAAVARNLMEADDFFDRALHEAKTAMNGYELRRFFATLMAFWPEKPNMKEFFDAHIHDLVEDYLHTARRGQPDAILEQWMVDRALTEIGRALIELGSSLREHGLPVPSTADLQGRGTLCLNMTFNPNVVRAKYDTLNDGQKQVYDTIVDDVRAKHGGFYFLNASGGTGKSYTLNAIIAALCSEGHSVCPTASSGIASTVLLGGRTIHSALKVPLECDHTSVCHIKKQTKLGGESQKVDCIIWDEAPMQSKNVLETLNRSLRDLRDAPDKLFSRVAMLLAGDWKQMLPVVRNGSRASIVSATHKRSPLWEFVVELTLSANMRVSGDDQASEVFRSYVRSVGDGSANVSANHTRTEKVRLPPSLMLNPPNP